MAVWIQLMPKGAAIGQLGPPSSLPTTQPCNQNFCDSLTNCRLRCWLPLPAMFAPADAARLISKSSHKQSPWRSEPSWRPCNWTGNLPCWTARMVMHGLSKSNARSRPIVEMIHRPRRPLHCLYPSLNPSRHSASSPPCPRKKRRLAFAPLPSFI